MNSNPQVEWGPFHHEIEVLVSGLKCNVTERYEDRLLFFPPDEEDLKNNQTFCNGSVDSYSVEVRLSALQVH